MPVIVALLLMILYIFLGLKRPWLALITVPIVCGLFIHITFLTNDSGAMFLSLMLAPVIFLTALISITLSRREAGFEQRPQAWARWLLLGFTVLLLVATGIVAVLNLPSTGFLFVILLVCTIGFAGAAMNYGLTSRHSTAAYVISTIGASMRQNLPLPMALESAAGSRRDARSKILRHISKWLVQGCSVSEAIKRGFPECPSYAVAMIAAAGRINQLPQAFKSIEADMVAKSEDSNKIEPVQPFYPLVLVIAVGFVVWGVLSFVMPSFQQILVEMTDAAALPAATRLLMRTFGFVGWGDGALFFIALAFMVLVVIPFCFYVRFRQRRPQEPYTTSQIGDFIKWHLPILRGFEKNYSMLHVAEMLKLSLNAGSTVNEAISNALYLDVNNCFRKRLQIWLERVEAGENISKAAKSSGVGGSLAWAFNQQANQGNTPAVLETLESLHRSNYNYRANLARFIASPCVTLIMGAFVGFVVYAIYSVPVAIIHQTAEAVYP